MNYDKENNILKNSSQKFGSIKKIYPSLHPQNNKHATQTDTY